MNEAALAVIRDVDRQIGELQTLRANLALLYRIDAAPQAAQHAPEKKRRGQPPGVKNKKRASQPAKHALPRAPHAKENGATPHHGITASAVLNALKSGGKTSGEVIVACPGLNAQQVYCALSVLRNQRRIVVRVDDADGGQKKNYLA